MNYSDDIRHARRTEEMKVRISDEDVQRSFLLYYKQFIDIEKRNRNKEAYKALLNILNKRIPKKIFQSNALIICDYPIMSEVFLTIFAKHPKLLSFRYLTLLDVSDCWEGKLQLNNLNIDDKETLYAIKDINEDVMCTYVSRDSLNAVTLPCQYLSSVMSERFTRRGKNLYKQISIVFFFGTKNLLEESRFAGIKSFFSSEYNGMVIDLNTNETIRSLATSLLPSRSIKTVSSSSKVDPDINY